MNFWGGSDDRKVFSFQEKHVGRWIDRPNGAIKVDGVALVWYFKTLGKDGLDHITGSHIFFDLFNMFAEFFLRVITQGNFRVTDFVKGCRTKSRWSKQAVPGIANFLASILISLSRVLPGRNIGTDGQALLGMVKNKQKVGDHKVEQGEI